VGPALVTAADLVRKYKADPTAADIAFTGQTVRVLVTACTVADSEVHWRPGWLDPLPPPAIVFQFDRPPAFKGPVWIEGVCRGTAAGPVLVTGCRIAPPPTRSGP
jgi:hypothetical protein